jgi:hypothetical protein
MNQTVILFNSTSCAIRADRELTAREIQHKLAPVPREMSSDCGYCIKLLSEDTEYAANILTTLRIDFQICPLKK